MLKSALLDALAVSIGQYSDPGRKQENQDFQGAIVPDGRTLALKGVALAQADGISSSAVSRVAAETAIKSFLSDYYCTSDAWTVKTAGHRVISALNSWLHAGTRRAQLAHDMDQGYVCTFSAVVVKSRKAHLFHVGDSRIYRLAGDSLEQLTNDHRVVLSSQENYLGRALGLALNIEIDYREIDLNPGDVLVMTTDGVHEYVSRRDIAQIITGGGDLDETAKAIAAKALSNGSPDNLTLQILRIDSLPAPDAANVMDRADNLPPAPLPKVPSEFEGYRILRQLHASHRSHIYLAADLETGAHVAIKIPSMDLRGDPSYLRRFAMEEWIARRLDSPHVLKSAPARSDRRYLYTVTEYVEGQTLRQWMTDNSRPDLESVRRIVEQIAKGLLALHRKEMLHQDLRPENIMIETGGTVKIIDFGAVSVAGVHEAAPALSVGDVPGTLQYAAPEYFLDQPGSERSDQFSLAVIAYEMLTGRLPYGPRVSRARTRAAQSRLRYLPAGSRTRTVPRWIDAALGKALNPDPWKRYTALSEFITDLRRPNPNYTRSFVPLVERNPVRFWQTVSLILGLIVVLLAAKLKLG